MTEVNEPTPDETGRIEVDTSAEVTDDDDDEPVLNMAAMRKTRAEAKKFRHLYRESEANRAAENAKHQTDHESALVKIAEYERREAERAAAEVLHDPADLWIHTDETEQRQWSDEFGNIVNAKVRAAAEAVAEQRPYLAKPNTAPPPTDRPIEHLRPGASPTRQEKPVSWAAAIRGTRP